MAPFLFAALLCLSALSSAAAVPPSLPANLTIENLVGAENLDPRFSVQVGWTEERIPGTSCYMISVAGLLNMGLKDFTGRMTAQTFRLHPYPEVQITVASLEPGVPLKRRFAVWGVYQAIYVMAQNNRFVRSFFYLSWEGNRVGIITYGRTDLAVAIGNESSKTKTNLAATFGIAGISNRTTVLEKPSDDVAFSDPLTAQRLTLSFDFKTTPLSIPEAFLTPLTAMVYAAQFDKLLKIDPFIAYPTDYDAQIRCDFHNRRRQTGTPNLTYGWVIQTLAQIPREMLRERRFSEVTVVTKLDDVPVGDAFLTKGRPVGADLNTAASSSIIRA